MCSCPCPRRIVCRTGGDSTDRPRVWTSWFVPVVPGSFEGQEFYMCRPRSVCGANRRSAFQAVRHHPSDQSPARAPPAPPAIYPFLLQPPLRCRSEDRLSQLLSGRLWRLHHPPVAHHEPDVLHHADVLERIPLHRDHVRRVTVGDPADLVFEAERPRRHGHR